LPAPAHGQRIRSTAHGPALFETRSRSLKPSGGGPRTPDGAERSDEVLKKDNSDFLAEDPLCAYQLPVTS